MILIIFYIKNINLCYFIVKNILKNYKMTYLLIFI